MPDALSVHEADRQAAIATAMLRAADHLGLSARDLSAVVGVSEAKLARVEEERSGLTGKFRERALLAIEVYRSLDAITGGDDAAARKWLRVENTALGGVPTERIRRHGGLADVLAYLETRINARS